jgi:protein SCO1/2
MGWLAGTLGLLVGLVVGACAIPLPRIAQPPATYNGGVLSPRIGLPELGLSRADGARFSTAETRGRVSLFFFGYTYCPDVCPMTLAHVAQVRKLLGSQASQVDAYFVTVDPERDTPERLARYTQGFDKAIVGLTGTTEELRLMQVAFNIVTERRPAPDGGSHYFMDHTAAVFLVDKEGAIRLIYPYGMGAEEIAADIKTVLSRT